MRTRYAMQAEVMLLESGGNVLDLNPSDAGVVNALRVWEDQRQPPWMHLVERALPTVAFDKRKRKEAQEDVQELLMQEVREQKDSIYCFLPSLTLERS